MLFYFLFLFLFFLAKWSWFLQRLFWKSSLFANGLSRSSLPKADGYLKPNREKCSLVKTGTGYCLAYILRKQVHSCFRHAPAKVLVGRAEKPFTWSPCYDRPQGSPTDALKPALQWGHRGGASPLSRPGQGIGNHGTRAQRPTFTVTDGSLPPHKPG